MTLSLRPESYLAVVEEALAEAGRDALVLSALDVQAILDWQRSGVPLALVLKGIRQGTYVFENTREPGAAFPRRVSYFAKWVAKIQESHRDRVFASTALVTAPDESPKGSSVPSPSDDRAAARSQAERCFEALCAQLRAGLAEAPGFARIYEEALADLEARRGSLSAEGKGESMDEDAVLHWAFEYQGRLVEAALEALDALGNDARATLEDAAAAQVRARFPMASASAVATKRRVELRRLLVERHGFVNVDMRGLTR